MVRIGAFLATLFILAFAPPAARAAWYEASSDHFVIYADDSEKDVRRFAENLERYHRAMEALVDMRIERPSPSNRVVIFVVGSGRELRRVAGANARNIAGFYVPRAGASRAFVQDIKNRSGYPHFSTTVLLHEYAHHFLISTSRYEMPRWLSEGAAEFFAAASFERDGGVRIGRVARHRRGELSYVSQFGLRQLLGAGTYDARRERPEAAFYGRSWLLYHYLTFTPERVGQIADYSRAIVAGMDPVVAGEEAFGDLDQLEREVMAYRKGRRFRMLELTPDMLPIGPVAVRRLPKGEAEVLPLRVRSQRGVTSEQATELVLEVREVAADYPDDPGVLTALAEAEFDAGNDDEAIAAAERAIAIDPNRANAYVQKGFALFRKAETASDRDAAYDAAMEPFHALNQRENDHPIPLIFYYRSYAERGLDAPENAKAALERAAELAPFDRMLWLNVARMQAADGKIEDAQGSLQPVANDPHGGKLAAFAQGLIAAMASAPRGEPFDFSKFALENETQPPEATGTSDETAS